MPQQYGQPPLDWPHYGIGPADAVARFFGKYATFRGRAGRGEYWWVVLFGVVVHVAFQVVAGVVGGAALAITQGLDPAGGSGDPVLTAYVGLYRLYLVGLLVPAVALAVRRLHDTGRSGWYALLGLIPVAGWVILLVLSIGDTSPEAERFGPPRESRPPSDRW